MESYSALLKLENIWKSFSAESTVQLHNEWEKLQKKITLICYKQLYIFTKLMKEDKIVCLCWSSTIFLFCYIAEQKTLVDVM